MLLVLYGGVWRERLSRVEKTYESAERGRDSAFCQCHDDFWGYVK
jgi:hypothetical protein